MSPAVLDLADWYGRDGRELEDLSDSELYRSIVATRHIQYREWPREELQISALPAAVARAAVAIDERTRSGWFAQNSQALSRKQYTWRSDKSPTWLPLEMTAGGDKPTGLLWTSSLLPDGTTAWARGVHEVIDEDAELYEIDYQIDDDRVYGIDSPGDYVRLCTRYPRMLEYYVNSVDWLAASADIDIVHLTARGLLTVQANTVPSPIGAVTLRGWDSESSVLLRPLGADESLRPATLPAVDAESAAVTSESSGERCC